MHGKGFALRLALLLLVPACQPEKKAVESSSPPPKSATLPSASHEPAASPSAGLEMVHRGVPLAEAKQVVVLFHGYGADMHDLAGFSRALQAGEDAAFVFPQAPTPLPRGGYRWFERNGEDFEAGLGHARSFVAWVAARAPQAGLVIGGFSQGAMITANLVADAPAQTRAALVFSASSRLSHPPSKEANEIRVFLSHGTNDPVIPYSEGEALRKRFQEAGIRTTWTSFDGSHSIPREVIEAANAFLESALR